MSAVTALVGPLVGRLDDAVGGPDRRRVVLALAGVLGLDSADKATVGAGAVQLQAALGIGKAQIGMLLAVSSLVGAAATLPAGMLADRVRRTRLLAGAVLCWAAAMIASGLAPDYAFLLGARLALGVVVAVAGPAVASLVGDFFPERDRARMYGFVLAGELVGAGIGFAVAGQCAVLSWRLPFLVLVAPTLVVFRMLRRLPEPARGGGDRSAGAPGGATVGEDGSADPADPSGERQPLAQRIVEDRGVSPRREAVLDEDQDRLPLVRAVRYVLAVRTNVVLIVASALGYFFFSGLRGFALEFTEHHYGLAQWSASALTLTIGVAALGGVLIGGRLADRLLRRGRAAARVEVPGLAVLGSAAAFVPALVTRSIALAVPLLMLAALLLGAANPPLDAARLDVIVAPLWGRAEAIRTVVRTLGDAAAPLVIGLLATAVFGGAGGLEPTLLLMLAALVASALLTLLVARRTYPHDVAAAAASAARRRSHPS